MLCEHAICGQPVPGLWIPGNESRQWWRTPEDGLEAVARVETEWGHLCHLDTRTECPFSQHLYFVPGFLPIFGLLSGGQVGHWASKLSLLVHLFPQGFQEVEERGDNQPSF